MNILLIGETCTDEFIYGHCNRLNPEAPTPVMIPSRTTTNDGMAGNVLHNLQALGCKKIKLLYQSEEIIKRRFVDEHSNYILLRVDIEPKIKSIKYLKSIEDYDMVIISDYNKGYLTEEVIENILNRAKISFVDSKRVIGTWANNATFIKINKNEANNPMHKNLLLSDKFYNKTVVTLGKDGCRLGEVTVKGKEVEIMDVVGAGDTFLAALSFKYLETKDIIKAMEFANECSAYVVTQKGVSVLKMPN